jgi:hypothetical protein
VFLEKSDRDDSGSLMGLKVARVVLLMAMIFRWDVKLVKSDYSGIRNLNI